MTFPDFCTGADLCLHIAAKFSDVHTLSVFSVGATSVLTGAHHEALLVVVGDASGFGLLVPDAPVVVPAVRFAEVRRRLALVRT